MEDWEIDPFFTDCESSGTILHVINDKVFIDDMKEAEIIIKSKKLIELTS